ncbi:hypothetical protein K458DRAFT_454577 [Lentithecium fluviatile CBS 122367]|uniref:Uncharacterized protein n=1 Tax=Lentithecium fluviatile CBS 122367 TaxID=1168545 RepID=A0A6G1JKA2_9PLEO|nr:hypothetical protein K458DRAFT_454577 [Lentithecium fluviatile CBS 122367]
MSAPNLVPPDPATAARAMISSSMQRTSRRASCHCREFTTSLFEELCAESAGTQQTSLDALLGYFRGAMTHTATILDCDQCRLQLESNMFLAMAGHYMGTMSERIVASYLQLRRELKDSEILLEEGIGDMWFSTYRIENKAERMQVLGSLVWVQLAEFSHLLEKLKKRAGLRSGPGVLLSETDKKVKAARSVLLAGKSTSAVPDGK